jgi:hypothetical protein
MYNLNYTPTTLGVQSLREIISGGTQTKKVEYHCSRQQNVSETQSVLVLRLGGETPTLLCPLERANLNHRTIGKV